MVFYQAIWDVSPKDLAGKNIQSDQRLGWSSQIPKILLDLDFFLYHHHHRVFFMLFMESNKREERAFLGTY